MAKRYTPSSTPPNSIVQVPQLLLYNLSVTIHYQGQLQRTIEPRPGDSIVKRANQRVQDAMQAIRNHGLTQGISF